MASLTTFLFIIHLKNLQRPQRTKNSCEKTTPTIIGGLLLARSPLKMQTLLNSKKAILILLANPYQPDNFGCNVFM
jgi:hypothetical protein